MKREFTVDSCFPVEVPVNADEIVGFLNEEAVRRGVYEYEPEDDTGAYVMDQIWEDYCNGKMGHEAVFEQEYTVGFEVEGRVYVDIKARGLDGAVESASAEVCDYDFGPLECIEWDEVNVEDSRGNLYRCEDEDFEDYPEQETEQSYTVCFAVKGRVYPRVAACSILEAVKKANDEVSDYDFGPLESIEWGMVYVEDPIGRRYDNKGNLSELAQACVDELIANAEAQKQEHNCLGECFEQDFVKE